MNKKRTVLLATMFMSLMCMYYTFTKTTDHVNGALLLSGVEALTAGETGGGDILYCYCALMSDASCAVNNNGSSKCASGVNVKCWEYNNNCN
ncbi:MAG: hypothetical protein IJ340_10240 [Odoribacter sp.]|uniref:hypothetical protein n=1 Tax=Odoribacter splanchnicus TaxID=28118 RepID=UPI0034BC1D32|nr:hypothetical protein [Odoribacter sp.]